MALIAARLNTEPLSKEVFVFFFFFSLFCCCVWRGEFCLFVCLFVCLFCLFCFVCLFSFSFAVASTDCFCIWTVCLLHSSGNLLRKFALFSTVMMEMRSFWCQFCVSVRRWYGLHRVRPKSSRTVPGITCALTEFFGRLQIDSHRRHHHCNIL